MDDPVNAIGAASHLPDDRRLYDLSMGIFGAQAFLVAYDLGLFAHLADGPRTLDEIAERFALTERSAEALVSVCVAAGAMERDGGQLALSSVGEAYLKPGVPTYLGDFLRGGTIAQPLLTSFPSVRRAIVEGRAQAYDGDEMFSKHADEAARAREFTMMMHGHAIASALVWPAAFDLGDVKHMLDVGGGSGAHVIGAALRWPGLTGEVFEITTVADVAREVIADYALSDRVSVSVGDFWTDPMPDADLHFYGDIFHDWTDEQCLELMAKSFAALPPGGRLMLHEVLYDDDKSGPLIAATLSVVMLAWTEGRQRSASEYAALLERAGFVTVTFAPAFGYWSIVAARKPAA